MVDCPGPFVQGLLPLDNTLEIAYCECNEPGTVTWVSSSPMTLPTSPGTVSGFQVSNGAGGWLDPLYAYAAGFAGGFYFFTCDYGGSTDFTGRTWRINARPTGIRESGEFLVPQTGTVGS